MWDLPYGLDKESWDANRLSRSDLKSVFNQLRVILTSPGAVLIAWCYPPQIGDLWLEMADGGFSDIHTYYWHKIDQNLATGTNASYTYCVESAVIGYYGSRSKCKFRKFSDNPSERHNIYTSHTHRDLFHYRGKPLNVHEKPIALAAQFISHHSDEGDKILILGSATGSEMLAAVELGRSCVGIEQDPLQFEGANDRLRSWWTCYTANLGIWQSSNTVPSTMDQAVLSFDNEEFWGSHISTHVGLPASCWCCGGVSQQECMDRCAECGVLHHSKPFARTSACRFRCSDCQPRTASLCSEHCHSKYFKGGRHPGKQLPGDAMSPSTDKKQRRSNFNSGTVEESSSSSSSSRLCLTLDLTSSCFCFVICL